MFCPLLSAIMPNVWLERVLTAIFSIGEVALALSLVAPAVLLAFRLPLLALAWLRGVNPTFFSAETWSDLSGTKKFQVYFHSIFLLLVTILGVISLIVTRNH